MKKQFQILTATIITISFMSCSKQAVETPAAVSTPSEEISTSSSSSRLVINPLTVNLEASFQFNGDLKDQTRKLLDGIPTTRFATYTTDRKGKLKGALYLNGTYGIKIKNVPQQTHTSLSVWVKPNYLHNPGLSYIAGSGGYGPIVNHVSDLFSGGVVMNTTIPGATFYINNTAWRHLVVTYDGSNVKFYVDGVLKDTNNEPGSVPTSLSDYFIGCLPEFPFWAGKIDDLRFYSRTLTATDVQNLYNL